MKNYLYIFISLLIFTSCFKEENGSRMIVIGSDPSVVITEVDTTLKVKLNEVRSLKLDLDGDNKSDVEFTSHATPGPILTWTLKYTIQFLKRGFELSVNNIIDTTYFFKYRTEELNGDLLIITGYEIYSCDKKTDQYDLHEISDEYLALRSLVEAEELDKDDDFLNEVLEIKRFRSTSQPGPHFEWPDSIYSEYTIYERGCHFFPTDQDAYIGFKRSNSFSSKLGWIKISFSGVGLKVIETAIQE